MEIEVFLCMGGVGQFGGDSGLELPEVYPVSLKPLPKRTAGRAAAGWQVHRRGLHADPRNGPMKNIKACDRNSSTVVKGGERW